MKVAFFLGLFLTATLFSYGQTAKSPTATKSEQKKEQHVKVMVSHDGKVTKIDTTFNFADEKLIQLKVDSLLKKLEVVKGKAGEPNIVIVRGMGHGGGNRQFRVMYNNSDSNGVKCEKKIVMIGKGGGITAFDSDGDMMMPPPPPPPPMPPFHVNGFKMTRSDPFAMDPDDKDIVTYDKKDIGKGLEKITIVRKKHTPATDEKKVEMKVEVTEDDKK
ncbi:MAG: hypothetical protein M0Q53_04700 [Prolixibacteraceae bacterium]|jgi:hypothetical protein|nr:hypothetical protein [Prolixibacteraceae bacterium]